MAGADCRQVLQMFDLRIFMFLVKVRDVDAFAFAISFCGTVLVNVEVCKLLGRLC